MKNAYKSELDPNNKQSTAMRQHVGAVRWAYNWGLERIKQAAANGERWPSAVDLHREGNKLKGTEALPWGYAVSKCAFVALNGASMRAAVWITFVVLWTTLFSVASLFTDPSPSAQAQPGSTLPAPPLFLPLLLRSTEAVPTATPSHPPQSFASVPVLPPPTDRPAQEHPDLNLALRSYLPTEGHRGLVNYGGDTDPQAPQLADMLSPPRLPPFRTLYQVYDWDWGCNPPAGCRGPLLTDYPVTLVELETTPGELLAIPSRDPSILEDFKALVLFASERSLSFTYTRSDSAAIGYLIHLDDFAVHPSLVERYRQLDADGRSQLPALRNGQIIGLADKGTLNVAVRDTGQFMDPRACKDWWNNYLAQCTVTLQRPR